MLENLKSLIKVIAKSDNLQLKNGSDLVLNLDSLK